VGQILPTEDPLLKLNSLRATVDAATKRGGCQTLVAGRDLWDRSASESGQVVWISGCVERLAAEWRASGSRAAI